MALPANFRYGEGMGNRDRDVVARRELARAIEALTDGAGRETWGPGPVGEKLYWLSIPASRAFDLAASAIMKLVDEIVPYGGSFTPAEFIEHMRRLAPPMLEVVLAAEQLKPPPSVEAKRTSDVFNAVTALLQKTDEDYRAKLSGSITDMFMSAAGLKPAPVICPPMSCISCGLKDKQEPSVHVRADGFPRCNSCWRECGAA